MFEASAAAYDICQFLSRAEIVGSTSASVSRPATVAELVVVRSHASQSPWSRLVQVAESTAASERTPIIAAPQRAADAILRAIAELKDLPAGWDGEEASAARSKAINEAKFFAAGMGNHALPLEPTLHVDGSVLLELDAGARGALLFPGDGTISYFIEGYAPATMALSDMDIRSFKEMLAA